MKVRCYDNSYLEDRLTVGRIYDVKETKENYYVIKDDKGITNLFWHGDFEIVKENEMEKTFREVITDIKKGEVWENEIFKIFIKDGCIKIHFINEERKFKPTSIGIRINEKDIFKLKRELFSFTEAFKAYEEGKEIESLTSKYKYKQNKLFSSLIDDWFDFYDDNRIFSLKEIRGKWYINN